MLADVGRTLVTLCIGGLGGALFFAFGAPLPWVLGSLAGTAALGRLLPKLSLAAPVRSLGVVVVGTLLGASTAAMTWADAQSWLPTLGASVVLAALFLFVSAAAGLRFLAMDRATAILSAVPAGLPLVSPMLEGTGARPERVGLTNTIRLITVLTAAAAVAATLGPVADAGGPLVTPQDGNWIGAFFVVLTACALAPRVPIPSTLLLVPLVLAFALSKTGLSQVAVPSGVVMLAQIVIGSGIGLHFRNYRIAEMPKDVVVSAVIGVLCISLALGAALALAPLSTAGTLSLFLAFVPAGAPEMSLLALALGANPALVVAHHVLRVGALATLTPFVVARFTRN